MVTWENLDKQDSYKKLMSLKGQVVLKDVLDGPRVKSCSVSMAGGLTYNYAAKQVNDQIITVLQSLSDEMQITEKFQELYEGAMINTGEKRLVLHHLTRGQLGKDVISEGKNKREFYKSQQDAIAEFAEKVHSGKITNADGEKFTTVVQIGIGGSDLGPRAIYLALEQWARKNNKLKMEAKFISNVDPDDGAGVALSLDLAHSLFVLVSKSGTTQETLANELFVKGFLEKAGLNPSKHMIAVTSETSPLANNPAYSILMIISVVDILQLQQLVERF